MAKPEEIDDLDALIDKAVDTFFVEAPSADELDFFAEGSSPAPEEPAPPPPRSGPRSGSGPSLDEAMDSLFSTSFQQALSEPPQTVVTSGDDDTDRAIDLAVDTLFVEEPDAAPPETMELEVTAVEVPLDAGLFREDEFSGGTAPAGAAKTSAGQKTRGRCERSRGQACRLRRRDGSGDRAPHANGLPGTGPASRTCSACAACPCSCSACSEACCSATAPPVAPKPSASTFSCAVHARDQAQTAKRPPAPPARPAVPPRRPVTVERQAEAVAPKGPVSPLRKLQEAILTLEWEISKRSIAVLSNELKRVRIKFHDDMTVDFAVVAMKLVLEYLAQRMSRAHPESIRFLLEVTDLLERSLGVTNRDPLGVFHRILTRYETFKSVVRKAEGLTDRRPPLLSDLEISDPQAFAKLVEAQALTLIKAGRSLARVMDKSRDPKNLIRSFRFLVNRSVNRILESTRKQKDNVKKDPRKKSNPTTSALR